VAKRIPKADVQHGDRRLDPYFWLREKTNPAVIAHLQAENAYTEAIMKPTEPLQHRLYQEMLGHIRETDMHVPYRDGEYFYYSRTEQGKQYAIHCRKKDSLDAPEEVTLDLNELGKNEKFMQLAQYTVSDDGNLLAYSLDRTGFRQYTLEVKDLRTGQVLPERIEKTGSIVWAADNRTIFYTVEDDAKRSYRLHLHRLGSPVTQDELVYEEKDERFELAAGRSRSRAYIFLLSQSHTTSEARYLRADFAGGREWRLIAPRIADQEYDVDHHGEFFYIRANDRGRNFRLVKAPLAAPGRENWQEVVPHRADVMIENADFFANHFVLTEREDGLPWLSITDLRNGQTHRITFPEPVYNTGPGVNAVFNTSKFRYGYESLVTPESVFEYDMDSREAKLLKQNEVPGYEPTRYEMKRLFATAPDGTRVPISLVHRQGLVRDGQAPLLLEGYGSYGYPYPVSFSASRLSLLDRGVVCAFAHIRGGGDFGKRWHDEGRMLKKRNTFTDFIACADFLVASKWTSPAHLAITGGSAGGLLMGAVVNMRPELFHAVVSHVPFVDVLNTMLDETLPLTVGEFEEWGNPKNPEEYAYMKTYSPYDNLRPAAYPAMLVKTSLNDSQVMYWEPAKYVARLRALKTDRNVLLLKVNMAAGHGGSSGRYDHLHEIAFDDAFLLTQLGVRDE